MAEKILVEIDVDSSQLGPAIDLLESLGQIDSKAAAAFRASNAELSKRAAIVKQTDAEQKKSVKTLHDVEAAIVSMSEAAVEGIQKDMTKALTDASKAADGLDKSVKSTKKSTDDAATSQKSLKQQLRELTQQLALLEVQGKRNTAEYAALVAQAGELQDAVGDANDAISNAGSDTRGLDNALGVAGAVTGAFAAAQGAAALFGGESEELQETLLKVNAAMSILAGIQQIQNLASQRQFQSTAALIGLQRVQTVQTGLQAAAESNYTVIRYSAIAAQKALNFVLSVSPLGTIIAIVAVAATAYAFFTRNTEDATKAQEKYNDTLQKTVDLTGLFITAISDAGKVRVAELQKQGASAEKIRQAELQNLREQLGEQEKLYDKNVDKYAANRLRLSQLGKKGDEKEAEAIQKSLDTFEKISADKEALKLAIELKELNNETAFNKEIADKQKEANDKAIAAAKERAEKLRALRLKQHEEELAAEESGLAELKKIRDENYLAQFSDEDQQARQKIIQDTNNEEVRIKSLKIREDLRRALLKELRIKEANELYELDKKLAEKGQGLAVVNLDKLESDARAQIDRITAAAAKAQEERTKKEKEEEEKRKQLRQQILQASYAILTGVADNYFSGQKEQIQSVLDAQLAANAAARDGEINNKNLTEQQKADIQRRYDEKQRILKRAAFEKQKQADIAQAIVNGLLAVGNALATVKPFIPAGLIAGGLAGGLAAIQVAKIRSTPIPAFRKGTQSAPGGWALVGEEGHELSYNPATKRYEMLGVDGPEVRNISKGTKIYTYPETKQIAESLMMPVPSFAMPSVSASVMASSGNKGGQSFDYDKMADAIAKKMPDRPGAVINMDKSGFASYIINKGQRQKVLNDFHKFSS